MGEAQHSATSAQHEDATNSSSADNDSSNKSHPKALNETQQKFNVASAGPLGATDQIVPAAQDHHELLADGISLTGVCFLAFALFKCVRSSSTDQTTPLMGTELE